MLMVMVLHQFDLNLLLNLTKVTLSLLTTPCDTPPSILSFSAEYLETTLGLKYSAGKTGTPPLLTSFSSHTF